jgi:hypothetical protein
MCGFACFGESRAAAILAHFTFPEYALVTIAAKRTRKDSPGNKCVLA